MTKGKCLVHVMDEIRALDNSHHDVTSVMSKSYILQGTLHRILMRVKLTDHGALGGAYGSYLLNLKSVELSNKKTENLIFLTGKRSE